MNKLVIFDLDGVLFESRDMHFLALNRALMWFGQPPIRYADHVTRYNGLPTWKKLEMRGIAGQTRVDILKYKQQYTRDWMACNVGPNPVFTKLFEDLRRKGYRIAVCSNAVLETVHTALGLLQLNMLADDAYSPEGTIFPPKPFPDLFYHAMGVADATPETTFIIEDSKVGIEAAKATGAYVIEVTGPDDVNAAVRAACLQ